MPNDDLISRKSALRLATALSEFDEGGWEMRVSAVKVDDLQNIPAEDAEPVRHGKWRIIDRNHAECSECKLNRNIGTQSEWEYCPKCGAKMFFVKEKDKWS